MNPTAFQLTVMESFAKGCSVKQIARSLRYPAKRVEDALWKGCVRAGIPSVEPEQIKAWFLAHPVRRETFDPYHELAPTMEDPMFQ